MTIYRPIGEQLLRKEEIIELSLIKGKATGEPMGKSLAISGDEVSKFKPIGINKPLLIEIRHVYTGEYPTSGWGILSPNDMLITTAVRSLSTFNSCPKAINFIKPNVKKWNNIRNPRAGEDGTPIVFYSPALVEPNSILDIEIIFDRFNAELVEGLGAAFTAAAGIPLFAAHSTHLLAAGAITKLAGKIGERLFDGKPSFSQTEELSFLRGGSIVPVEGFHLIAGEDFIYESEGCKFDYDSGRLIYKKNMKEYSGRHPYVVISLDGVARQELKSFVPTAASAALLEKFYHIKEGQEQSIDILMEAVKLYNDVQYKSKADDIMSKLEKEDENTEYYSKLIKKKDAFLSNIITDVFKNK